MSFIGLQFKPILLMRCYQGLLLSVFTLALVTGCEQAASPRDAGVEARATEKVNENKVTAAEAKQFAKEFLSAINRQDLKKIQQLVYWKAIVDRIFVGLPIDNEFYRKYSTGAKTILGKFSNDIETETGAGGSYSLLKIIRRGKDRHVIFRTVSGTSAPSGGGHVNYHNLRLIKIDEQVRADDIYIARAGSWMSEIIKKSLRPILLKSERPLDGFSAEHIKEIEEARLIAGMVEATRSGDKSEALKVYQQLPEDVKNTKTVLGARLLATEGDEFLEAVEAMVSKYPNNPAVGLSLIDYGTRQEDLEMLKRATELLEKWTGGDPYIDLAVAVVMSKLGQADEASELTREISLKEFDFINPVFLKYKIALASKDNETLLECFRALRDDYDQDISQILEADVCKDFVESIEYVDLQND